VTSMAAFRSSPSVGRSRRASGNLIEISCTRTASAAPSPAGSGALCPADVPESRTAGTQENEGTARTQSRRYRGGGWSVKRGTGPRLQPRHWRRGGGVAVCRKLCPERIAPRESGRNTPKVPSPPCEVHAVQAIDNDLKVAVPYGLLPARSRYRSHGSRYTGKPGLHDERGGQRRSPDQPVPAIRR